MDTDEVGANEDVARRKNKVVGRWAAFFAVLSAGIALITAVSAFTTFNDKMNIAFGREPVSQAQKLAADNAVLKDQVASLTRQVNPVKAMTEALPAPESSAAKLSAEVADLTKREQRIEDAISRDPARALEVPLLRKDVDNIKDSQAQATQSMNQRIDQIVDLNKWLLGGAALSLLSIAASTLLYWWTRR